MPEVILNWTIHFKLKSKCLWYVQTYKGGLHFTVICYANKCIIGLNERYIPEHQNKLNMYDLQNYEFCDFFNRKKIHTIH